MRWGTEEPGGPLPNLQPTPTPGLSSQEITCVLAARSGLSWICCCCLQGKASHNASLPSSPRSIRVSHKYHRHGPPAGSLTHHFSTFPATKTWELDFSPGSQPFLCGDYFFFSISETTFTYYKIHHFNHFDVQFSGLSDPLTMSCHYSFLISGHVHHPLKKAHTH